MIANDRGHLVHGIPRSTESPWGSFIGTWQAEQKPVELMTKTKLMNPRTIIKSPAKSADKPVGSKPITPSSKVEDGDKRTVSPAKTTSPKPSTPLNDQVLSKPGDTTPVKPATPVKPSTPSGSIKPSTPSGSIKPSTPAVKPPTPSITGSRPSSQAAGDTAGTKPATPVNSDQPPTNGTPVPPQ